VSFGFTVHEKRNFKVSRNFEVAEKSILKVLDAKIFNISNKAHSFRNKHSNRGIQMKGD
jgi:hypothetical protein